MGTFQEITHLICSVMQFELLDAELYLKRFSFTKEGNSTTKNKTPEIPVKCCSILKTESHLHFTSSMKKDSLL